MAEFSQTTPAPLRPRPAWLLPTVTGLVGLLLGIVGTVLAPQVLGSTTTVRGGVYVTGSGAFVTNGTRCQGAGGYADLQAGAEVVVTDAAGTTIGVASLRAGQVDRVPDARSCVLPFEVKVPGGKGFYGVQVGSRDRVQVAESALGSVKLSVGG